MKRVIVIAFLFAGANTVFCAENPSKLATACAEIAFKKSSYCQAEATYGAVFKQPSFQRLAEQDQIRAKVNCGEAKLALHKFKEGYELFDARLQNTDPNLTRKLLQKPWDGSWISGALLDRDEKGIGDLFFSLAQAKKAHELGIPVIVRARGKFLKPLLVRQPYIKAVITSDEEEANTVYHADIYAMSLPRYLSNKGFQPVETIDDIPYTHGYIEPRVDLVDIWKNYFSKKQGLNIVIGAYRASANIAGECRFLERDVPIAVLLKALWKPGVNLYYCSGGDHRPITRSEYNTLNAKGTLGKLDEHDIIEDADMPKLEILEGDFDKTAGAFEDTAAAMCAADRVISVDTSTAMLAGALGDKVKKFSVLLPKESDWRWGEGQPTTSPFFANATLFWQHEQNDWSAPLAALCSDVEKSIAKGKSEKSE